MNEHVSSENVKLLSRQPGDAIEEAVMTVADKLIEEGRKEGRQEGAAGLLLNLLQLRFGPLAPAVVERVTSAEAARLQQWAARVLTAAHLDDVFDE